MTGIIDRSRRAVAGMLGVAALWALAGASGAAAMGLNLEVRQLTAQGFPFGRNVYLCPTCSLADFASVQLPAPTGWEQDVPKWRIPDATAVIPTPPAGVPASLDLVAGLPGDEFVYVARVLGGTLLGSGATLGALALADVERDTVFTYHAGDVVHEVFDTEGRAHVLFTIATDLLATYDLSQEGSLAGLVELPNGWSYASRTLNEDFVVASGGLAHVFSMGGVASWQRVSVPEPGPLPLLAAGFAVASGARRRRRARRVSRQPSVPGPR